LFPELLNVCGKQLQVELLNGSFDLNNKSNCKNTRNNRGYPVGVIGSPARTPRVHLLVQSQNSAAKQSRTNMSDLLILGQLFVHLTHDPKKDTGTLELKKNGHCSEDNCDGNTHFVTLLAECPINKGQSRAEEENACAVPPSKKLPRPSV
jgi:hypothetical protein